MKRFLTVLIFLFAFVKSPSQDLARSTGMQNMVLVYWENDIFLRTDYYFTNGAAAEFISPALQIKALDNLLYMPLKNGYTNHSISLRQNMYTPEKMFEPNVQRSDRPYAGYFIGEYKLTRQTSKKKFSSSFSLGILGEYSFAARTQDFVHSLDEMVPAAGWQYQVKNAPVINLNSRYHEMLVQNAVFDMQLGVTGRIGSLYTDVSADATLRVGKRAGGFDFQTTGKRTTDFECYLFMNTASTLSYFDATLQGSILNYLPSEHYFNNSERYMFVSKLTMGWVISYNHLRLKTSLVHLTPEFKGGRSHGWGEVSLGISF